jgi:AhpC/TSA family
MTKYMIVAAALLAAPLAAQQPAAPAPTPPPDPTPLTVGTMAPDFTLSGSTRYGVLKAPIHLSDFKGKTVVLAFFYKARTRG